MVRVAASLVGCGLLIVACGGGGTTTVIEKTVTTGPTTPSPSATTTYLLGLATTDRFQQPSRYPFSADGDLVGSNLSWTGWGTATATATGTFAESQRPSMKTASYPGTLTVTALKPCNGARYYTQLHLSLPSNALFQPQLGSPTTPCG